MTHTRRTESVDAATPDLLQLPLSVRRGRRAGDALSVVGTLAPPRQGGLTILSDDRVAIRHGSCVDIVDPSDIVSIHAKRNVTIVATLETELRVYLPIGAVLEALRRFGMTRVHRGMAVNVARIRRVVGRGRHRVIVVLDTGAEHAVGRAFQSALRLHLAGPGLDR